jgi:polar amino acid transport system permease protein
MYDWNFGIVKYYIPQLFSGLYITLTLSIQCILFGTLLGIFVSYFRFSETKIISIFCQAFIEIFLALPVLVLLIWVYYCLPLIGIRLNSFLTTGIVFSLSLSAFVAETLRTGYESITEGQIEAAKTFLFTRFQIYRYIVFPQALKLVLPALLTQYITAIKLSTIASIIGLYEVLHMANDIVGVTYRPLEIYTILAFLFVVIIAPLNIIVRWLEKYSKLLASA